MIARVLWLLCVSYLYTLWMDGWMDGQNKCEQMFRWCLCNIPIYLLIPLTLIPDWSNAVGHNICWWVNECKQAMCSLFFFLLYYDYLVVIFFINQVQNKRTTKKKAKQFSLRGLCCCAGCPKTSTNNRKNVVQCTQAPYWYVIIFCR